MLCSCSVFSFEIIIVTRRRFYSASAWITEQKNRQSYSNALRTRHRYHKAFDHNIDNGIHAFSIWLNPSLIVRVFVKRLYCQFILRCEIKMPKRGRKTSAIVAPKYLSITNFLETRKQEPISAELFVLSIFFSFKFILRTVSRIKDVMKHQFIKVNYDSLQFYCINTSVQL